jgi:single-stranded-DNA-specific exonuclease
VKASEAKTYLNPSLRESLPDPYGLMDMERAARRIADAAIGGETVGVFGDYDVDGTSAAAIFKLYFDALDAPLEVYLPDRMAEGYGPSIEAFRALKTKGANLIVTVDCGAAAHETIEQAAAEELDIIVVDHHLMSGPPPAGALATINPNRADDHSGLDNICAAGLAFLTLVGVNRILRHEGFFEGRKEPDLFDVLDLAALGLVCDVMAMTGLARVLTAQGLKVLARGGNAGLQALSARAGVKGPPSAYHLGFVFGPRINAAGRIGHARLALELLTTRDPERRAVLADKLHVMNAQRQAIEAAVQESALRAIERDGLFAHDVIVVAGADWHPGVIGIVAGRIKEIYDKPTVVIGIDGESGKGSGRSISGVDLGAAVGAAKNDGLLIAGGGHDMAAGLTIRAADIDALRRRLNTALSDACRRARMNRTLMIDAVIAPDAVTKRFAEMAAHAGPFGPGNPEPVFALADMRAEFLKTVGENHIAATLRSATGPSVRAIAFRADGERLGEALRADGPMDVAGKIRADDWRGGDAGQMHIVDVARSG